MCNVSTKLWFQEFTRKCRQCFRNTLGHNSNIRKTIFLITQDCCVPCISLFIIPWQMLQIEVMSSCTRRKSLLADEAMAGNLTTFGIRDKFRPHTKNACRSVHSKSSRLYRNPIGNVIKSILMAKLFITNCIQKLIQNYQSEKLNKHYLWTNVLGTVSVLNITGIRMCECRYSS